MKVGRKMKMKRLAAAFAAMTVLCFCVDMAKAASPQTSGAVAEGKAYEWDFTKGLPSGGKPRKCAVVSAKGLSPLQMSKSSGYPSGIEFRDAVLPEAFEFEAEFEPLIDWKDEADIEASKKLSRAHMIWDSMGVNYAPKCRNKGMQVMFYEYAKRWNAKLYVGMGDRMCQVSGPSFLPERGKRMKLTLVYDGLGRVQWNLDGETKTCFLEKAGVVVHDKKRCPIIGDRICDTYNPFNGYIRKVSVKPMLRESFAVRPNGRTAFERCEENAVFKLDTIYCGDEDVSHVTISAESEGPAIGILRSKVEKNVPKIASGSMTVLEMPVETRLKPGKYTVMVSFFGRSQRKGEVRYSKKVELSIGETFADRLPTVMWGSSGSDPVVRDFGFTHVLRYFGLERPECDPESARVINDVLDSALASGMRTLRSMRVRYPQGDKGKYYRCLRDGGCPNSSHEKEQPEVGHPEMIAHIRKLASTEAANFGTHPAFQGVLTISEMRDHVFPSFCTEHLRYKKDTGKDVPAEAVGKTLHWRTGPQKLQERYPDGVVPVDDPLLSYYSWFWGGGDGWPAYQSAIADEYRKVVGRYGDGSEMQRKRPFFSFWDPAVRCPPKWGAGGDIDALNQWVYAQPEPMNVAGPAEEIIAMADGRPGQHPMIMTQLICYRVNIAPTNVVVAPVPDWVKRRPKAGFPTIPADALQEALWSMLAKPVKGVMFHGWGTICETGSETGYTYTSPEAAKRLRELLTGVVAPLGPTLKGLGREQPEVAVLESFTSTVFGGPASWGWLSPAITFLQRARLDPRVVYEETIMRDGLEGTKILYAPQCLFLSAPVVERIRAFQKAGGILVGDEKLMSGLKADITVPIMAYKRPPKSDHTEDVDANTQTRVNTVARRITENNKKEMLDSADKLRKMLSEKYGYRPKADSSSGEIVVYSRAWKDTPYVVAVNDKRTFGDYVGQWGLTMEKGLPFSGTVCVSGMKKGVGAVYELSRGGEVKFTRKADGTVEVPLSFDTNDGRLLVFLEQKIEKVELEVQPAERKAWWAIRKSPYVKRGGEMTLKFSVKDGSGRPVPARLPVEVHVYDAKGAELDGAGYACAVDGVCTLTVRTNLNDPDGSYRIVCRDRASGLTCEQTVMQKN